MLKLLNNTLGKIVRTIQSMLIRPREKSVLDFMLENAKKESAIFAKENFAEAVIFGQREELFYYVIESYRLNSTNTVIFEFGVFEGESINLLSKLCPQAKIYGFDSFEGLQENMSGYSLIKGHFNLLGVLPKVGKNVSLVKGWYKDTIKEFLVETDLKRVSLLHLDSDTYESTIFVLENLSDLIKPGTVLIFDDFFGIIGWENHGPKAWAEFSNSKELNYKYIGFTNMQVAIEIL